MTARDIMGRLSAAQADAGTDEVLQECGVPADITPICGRAHVRSHGSFFEFDPGGKLAIIHPVFDGGEPVDLLAYVLHRTQQFRVWTGACPLLGVDNMGIWSEPLHIRRTPLDYLRASLDGVVVLSWPCAIPLLRSCSDLVAEDVEHGEEIRKHLTRPVVLPKISVPAQRCAA